MPITHHKGSTTISGDSMTYFRICALRAAVKLEMADIRVRRGPKVVPQVKREFGIRGNAEAVLAFLEQLIAELAPQQEHVIDGRRYVDGQEVN